MVNIDDVLWIFLHIYPYLTVVGSQLTELTTDNTDSIYDLSSVVGVSVLSVSYG